MQFLLLSVALGQEAETSTPEEGPPPRYGGGRAVAMVYGGTLGVFTAASVASVTESPFGFNLGAGVGVGTAYLLTRQRPLTLDQAVFVSSAGGMGAFTGYQMARTFIPPGAEAEDARIAAAGVLGSYAGTGLGIALANRAPRAGDMLGRDIGMAIGWQMGAGAMDLLGYEMTADRAIRAPVGAASGWLMMGAVSLVQNTDYPRPTASMYALGLGHGAWIGAWTPFLISDNPDPLQVAGGLRLGMGAGYATAYGAAALRQSSGTSTFLQTVGALSGTAIGAGIPLSRGASSTRAVVAPMLASGVAGQLAGMGAAYKYTWTPNDAALTGVLLAWTGYQTLGWSWYATETAGAEPLGVALTTSGVGTAVAVGMAPFVDVAPSESLFIASGGAWGSWFGLWGSSLVTTDPHTRWMATQAAGNGGLLLSAVLTRPLDIGWGRLGLINGLGAAGAAGGALTGLVFLYDNPNGVPTAALAGAAAGLGTGIYLSTRSDSTAQSWNGPRDLPTLPVQASFAASPWTGGDGSTGVYAQLTLTERGEP